MNRGSFGYLLKQGLHSVWINRVMSAASIGILTACLILVGAVSLLALNVRGAFDRVENETEMIVYIEDDATEAQMDRLEEDILGVEHVIDAVFISKEEAVEIQKESLGEQGYLLEGLGEFLPAGFRVYVDGLENMTRVHRDISALDKVLEIYVPTQLVEVLTSIRNVVWVLGLFLIGILVVASVVVISNTIKLTVFNRRREINIMKYVGATNRFIRLPFIVEGITIGLIAASLSFLVVMGAYESVVRMLSRSSIGWLSTLEIIPFWDIWYWVIGLFAAAGTVIGMFGSGSAMRRYLKV